MSIKQTRKTTAPASEDKAPGAAPVEPTPEGGAAPTGLRGAQPHKNSQYFEKGTWLEPESLTYPSGGFKRRANVVLPDGKLRIVKAATADTMTSVPARFEGGGNLLPVKGFLMVGDDRALHFYPEEVSKPRVALYQAPALKGEPVKFEAEVIKIEEIAGQDVARCRTSEDAAWAMGPVRVGLVDDDQARNPRTDQTNMAVIKFWGDYKGDEEHHVSRNRFDCWQRTLEDVKAEIGEGLILPIYIYEHSDVSFKAGNLGDLDAENPLNPNGFLYASLESLKETYLLPDLKCLADLPEETREIAVGVMKAELQEYEDYVRNNCYGFVIENAHGSEGESCFGFLGDVSTSGIREEALERLEAEFNDFMASRPVEILLDEQPDAELGDEKLDIKAVLGVKDKGSDEQHRILILTPKGGEAEAPADWTLRVLCDAPENARSASDGFEMKIDGEYEEAVKIAKTLAAAIIRCEDVNTLDFE